MSRACGISSEMREGNSMIVWRMGLTQALDHVVKEFGPDTTYPNELKDKGTCRYVHPDGMSALCLWGQVL
jgi:hypothetical protein